MLTDVDAGLIRRGGIPPAHRGLVWQYMLGSKARGAANPTLYKDLLIRHQNDVSKATVQIDKVGLRLGSLICS